MIASRAQKPPAEVEETLEKLAHKGFLYKRTTDAGKIGYALIQIGFGIPQIFYWKGETTEEAKEIAGPMATYLAKGVEGVAGPENTHLFRYVLVNKAVDHTLQAVLPYDMMKEVVNKAKKIAVVHCPADRQPLH